MTTFKSYHHQFIFNVVRGAVKNAADAHPDIQIKPQYRESIAKRAAGMLVAQLPQVLTAKPSDRPAMAVKSHRRPQRRAHGHLTPSAELLSQSRLAGKVVEGAQECEAQRTLLGVLRRYAAEQAYAAGAHTERQEAFLDMFRKINECS